MQITIYYPSGLDVEGVVLSITETRLRVAMRDWDDAAEFRWLHDQWISENGYAVQIAWPESGVRDTTERLFDGASLRSPGPVVVN